MSAKKLGMWQGAGLLATTLLGTSVFILPQMTITLAGNDAIWSWVILTLLMLPVALVFATLSGKYPHAGGPSNFAALAFGKNVGQVIGLIFLLVVPIGAPAALIMTFEFVDSIIHLGEFQGYLVQMTFLLVIYLLNLKGVSVSASLQLGLTLVIAGLVCALLLLFALEPTSGATQPQTMGNPSLLFSAAALAFWSFLGIEAMAHLSSDFKRPKTDLVPAILIGTALVGLVYIACTYLVIHVQGSNQLAMINVFDQLIGGYGSLVIGGLGIAGGIATVNVYTASCAKLMSSFSHQGLLPKSYSIHNRNGVAYKGLQHLVLLMALILTVSHSLSLDLELLVGLCNGVFVLIYLVSMLAALKLLSSRFYGIAIFGAAVCLTLAISLGWQMAYALGLVIVVSPFVLFRKKQAFA